MQIEVWSDVVCPWCYIGRRRLLRAIASAPTMTPPTVVHRSFLLDPTTPRESTLSLSDMLARKYDLARAQVDAMQANVTALAKAEGVEFHLELARPENTLDAHRLLHGARQLGRGEELLEGLFAAYFVQGRSVSDATSLVAIAQECGVDAEEAERIVHQRELFHAEVQADLLAAKSRQIRGVPFFLFDGQAAMSGAQPVEVLRSKLI